MLLDFRNSNKIPLENSDTGAYHVHSMSVLLWRGRVQFSYGNWVMSLMLGDVMCSGSDEDGGWTVLGGLM